MRRPRPHGSTERVRLWHSATLLSCAGRNLFEAEVGPIHCYLLPGLFSRIQAKPGERGRREERRGRERERGGREEGGEKREEGERRGSEREEGERGRKERGGREKKERGGRREERRGREREERERRERGGRRMQFIDESILIKTLCELTF